MPSTADISPLSITDGKISNEARIAHAKLAKATEGQILVAQSNGKFAAKSLAGDVTLDASGNTTSNVAVSTDGTTVVTGATGAKGDTGSAGSQGATGTTGAAGTDATVSATTVNAAGAIMHTDVPDSDTGFVKRTGAETYDVDTATYSTDGHSHILSDVTDSGTSAALDVPATGNAASGEVVKGSDTRLTDTRTPSSTLAHKSSHETGESDALSPSDIGAESAFSKNTGFNKNLGATTGTVCAGDDSRLSDTRTPSSTLAHKASHATGAADALSPADIGASASGHTHAYADITSKPSTFAPSSHNHAGTDITSGTIDTDRLDVGASSGKVAAGDHAHASYITGNQSITLSGDVSGSGTTAITCVVADNSHSHSTATLTGLGGAAEKDVGTGSGDVAQGNHTHDGRYYQESEFLNASAGAGDAGKPVKLDAAGHIDSTMINDGDISFVDLDDLPSTFAPDIDDSSASTTDVWSASKIISYLASFYATLSNGFSSHKYTATVTGDASGTTIFYVTHNLGTYYVVVSVRHPIITGSSATTIDDMFDADQYTLMDVGHSVAPGVEVATINSSGNVCDDCIAIRFPTAPANGDDYLVTIIG